MRILTFVVYLKCKGSLDSDHLANKDLERVKGYLDKVNQAKSTLDKKSNTRSLT